MQEHKSPHAFRQLRPHHRSLARAVVAGGLTPKQLAIAFGFTEGHVSRILQTPLFEAELERLERNADDNACDMREDLVKMAERGLEVLDEDLHIEPTTLQERALRQRAATDVLDRVGLRKPDKPFGGNGGSVNLHQTQINIQTMSEKELRDDVMELIENSEGEEEGLG